MKEIFKKILVENWEREIPPLVERPYPTRLTDDVLAVIGPRRVGKTYFMYQIIKNLLQNHHREEIIFIDFEDNRLAGLKTEELDDLFVAYHELSDKEPKYIFLDEVQAVEHWSKFVRRLHNTKKYKLVVSGSSSKLLSREIATELRGRYKSLFIAPFAFAEFLNLKGYAYSPQVEHSEQKGKLLRLFQEYLSYGGYPEVIREKDLTEKKSKVKSYYETIFYKDLVERYKITNYEVLEALINYLLNNSTAVFSITKFERLLKEKDLNVSKKTISSFLRHLEEAFFVFAVEEFSYSYKKRLMRPKKTYLLDNALITFLSIQFSPDWGKLLENLVLGQLWKESPGVYFFKGKNECDFVIKERNQIVRAIQVCYELNDKNKEREIKGLLEALDYFKLKKGLILTNDQESSQKARGKEIEILPVWKWLLK